MIPAESVGPPSIFARVLSMSMHRAKLAQLHEDGRYDLCAACGLQIGYHWDTAGCVWIGCQGALKHKQLCERRAVDHAVLAAARRLAEHLYPVQPGDEPPTALSLSDEELKLAGVIVATVLTTYQEGCRYQQPYPEVQGVWREALDKAVGR